jgi:hypothetical protein
MRFVAWLVADTDKHQYDGIRHEIAEGVDGISYHGGTMSQDASHKLEEQQGYIHHAAHQCHLIYLLTSFLHFLTIQNIKYEVATLQRYE